MAKAQAKIGGAKPRQSLLGFLKGNKKAYILQPNTTGMPSYVKAESEIAYQYTREMDARQIDLEICIGSRILNSN